MRIFAAHGIGPDHARDRAMDNPGYLALGAAAEFVGRTALRTPEDVGQVGRRIEADAVGNLQHRHSRVLQQAFYSLQAHSLNAGQDRFASVLGKQTGEVTS